jgi:signal transduction histidine kinase
MLHKLSQRITTINVIALVVVVLIGGISLYFTAQILHNGYKIKELSEDIIKIDDIYSHSYRLVLAMHHFLIYPYDEIYSEEILDALNSIEHKTKAYKAYEEKELNKEALAEIKYLDEILEDVEGLKNLPSILAEFSRTGDLDREKIEELEEYAYHIENRASEINKIHFIKINEWEIVSLRMMWVIMILFILFITFGGTAIAVGHNLISDSVVKPITILSDATSEFSDGRFYKRVSTDSQTEIGLLYRSFNTMAGKLQEHDELLRRFNQELEGKVEERTNELKALNEQLKKMQKELIRTEKKATVGQIAAGVTHEIKNPLNVLSVNVQMLSRQIAKKLGADSAFTEEISLISHEVNRINKILDEFVSYAKFPEPEFRKYNINRIITETVNFISTKANEAGVTIKTSLQEDMPDFMLDAHQMKAVFTNLIQNSINAMPKGGTVEIETEIHDRDVVISVSDSGEGIPEKELDNIFTPFFSTREGGMGLGLSIVQGIVESHGGNIRCTSQPGKGTVFKITVPAEKG